MQLNWTIERDHWEAKAPEGTYYVGDWGRGKEHTRCPGQMSVIVPDGKAYAQAYHDALQVSA